MSNYNPISDLMIGPEAASIENILLWLRDNPIAIAEGSAGAPRVLREAIESLAIATSKIADGAVTGAKIADGAVVTANLANDAVPAGKLKTTFSLAISTLSIQGFDSDDRQFLLLSGVGEYCFFPQMRSQQARNYSAIHAYNRANDAFHVGVEFYNEDVVDPNTVELKARYVQASPPYDLGDGHIPQFIYLDVDNSTGKVMAASIAADPPWRDAKTQITPQIYHDGRGFRFKDREQWEFLEVTPEFKNTDMPLIPHPFRTRPDRTVVLVDPVSRFAQDMHDRMIHGDADATRFFSGDWVVDNTPLKRKAPPGVAIHGIKVR